MSQKLKPGTILHASYRIERAIGQGGFGITYLATDLTLDRKVAVKEFFPQDYCNRDGETSHITVGSLSACDFVERLKAKFLKEARNIAKFDYPGIIRIHSAFEENNTAYYVMEYIEGASLWDIVKRNGPLDQKQAIEYIKKVGDALSYVHQRLINHLDVKPANIMLRRSDNTPILIDFGLSKQYDQKGLQTSTTPAGISHGFAPIEQYKAGGVSEFSPQTDVYSLAATLYFLLSGTIPPQASEIIETGLRFPDGFPERLASVISMAMSNPRFNRQPTVADFIAEITEAASSSLSSSSSTGTAQSYTQSTEPVDVSTIHPTGWPDTQEHATVSVQEANKKKKRFNMVSIVGLIFGVFAVVAAIKFWSESSVREVPIAMDEVDSPTETFTVNGVSFSMVPVEGGTFMMGSNNGDDDEKPVHSVTLSDYMIGETEVTQALWEAVMGSNPSYRKGDNLPVEQVSWNDCQEFIRKLNSITGQRFRLPTEAEWEYAARGGSMSQGYEYSGSDNLGDVAWYYENSGDKTHSVKTKDSNELGLYDMSGNVWEWCEDWYDINAYSSHSSSNPKGPSSGSRCVYRGGSYYYGATYCRAPFRRDNYPSFRNGTVGFRLALD